MIDHLAQILMLLGVAVAVVIAFQRMHIPTSLGYLLTGVILSPHTLGPSINISEFKTLADFGVVFLLFTIGLSYSLPQLHALRNQVLGLGTAQILLSTVIVWALLWLLGIPSTVAFVIGAVFAQSSSTIIGNQLAEQREINSPPGRLGLAMSVFQDVTAVPFLIVIPVLGMSVGVGVLAGELGWALVKAVAAFLLVFFAGRWLLRPLFHLITTRRSAELFTLAVLLVMLLAAWTTNTLGLSLAFGAFLAGMMLGETEFRHQVESSVRPFRDVLLGLFFIGIGMLINPGTMIHIWYWAVLGALLMLISKMVIVAAMVRKSGIDALSAWRTGLILAVGGEFGLALLALALDSQVIDEKMGQILLASVLLSMIAGSILIHFNQTLARLLAGSPPDETRDLPEGLSATAEQQVILGGYGRVGHVIAVLLHSREIPFVAFDIDPKRVAQGRTDGHKVLYGDISDPELLTAIKAEYASLILITVDDAATALRTTAILHNMCPHVPVIARARDLETSTELLDLGAIHAFPESIEASLHMGAIAMQMLNVPPDDIEMIIEGVREWGYKPVLEKETG